MKPRAPVWSSGPDPTPKPAKASTVTKKASEEAAAKIAPKVPSIREDVMRWIRNRSSHGGTCDELELATGLTHQTASARVHELMKQERIKPAEKDGKAVRRPTRSGAKATVWVAAEGL